MQQARKKEQSESLSLSLTVTTIKPKNHLKNKKIEFSKILKFCYLIKSISSLILRAGKAGFAGGKAGAAGFKAAAGGAVAGKKAAGAAGVAKWVKKRVHFFSS